MRAVDLSSHRTANIMKELQHAREAPLSLDSDLQLQRATLVMGRLAQPRSERERVMLIDALEFSTDALCNKGRTAQARQLAQDTFDLLRSSEDGPASLVSRPQTLAGYRAVRVLASTIELDGDPDRAMRWLSGIHKRLFYESGLGDIRIDAIRILRGVLSAAKRDGSRAARHFAAQARVQGDRIIDEVAKIDPPTAAGYLHRAGLERRTQKGAQAHDEALTMLEASMPLRPDTPRDLRSRGMATGEIAVLSGELEEGARIMTETANAFAGVLPRHADSALKQLGERDLLRAA